MKYYSIIICLVNFYAFDLYSEVAQTQSTCNSALNNQTTYITSQYFRNLVANNGSIPGSKFPYKEVVLKNRPGTQNFVQDYNTTVQNIVYGPNHNTHIYFPGGRSGEAPGLYLVRPGDPDVTWTKPGPLSVLVSENSDSIAIPPLSAFFGGSTEVVVGYESYRRYFPGNPNENFGHQWTDDATSFTPIKRLLPKHDAAVRSRVEAAKQITPPIGKEPALSAIEDAAMALFLGKQLNSKHKKAIVSLQEFFNIHSEYFAALSEPSVMERMLIGSFKQAVKKMFEARFIEKGITDPDLNFYFNIQRGLEEYDLFEERGNREYLLEALVREFILDSNKLAKNFDSAMDKLRGEYENEIKRGAILGPVIKNLTPN